VTRTLLAGCRYQFAVLRRSPADLVWLFVSPLYAVIFLLIFQHAGQDRLVGYAVVGPAMMGLVGTAVMNAGDIIEEDRYDSLLGLQVAAPGSLTVVVAGRVLAVMITGLLAIAEVWLVAGLFFGRWVVVSHPWVFVLTVILTVLSTSGMALLMSALFVLARSARLFQNSLTIPLFVLGGVIVPVDQLPGWLPAITRVVYLSWATDLLRDSTAGGTVADLPWRFGALAGLGGVSVLLGAAGVHRVVLRGRAYGSLDYA
jgi:ABC-2 type transport system permease protein